MTAVEKTLTGKVAVITGGSRGIGKSVAEALIRRGARVVIGDVLENEGKAIVKEFNTTAESKVASFIKTDVSKYNDNIALFQFAEQEFGGVDIAYLNAGIAGQASNIIFSPVDEQFDEQAMSINALSVMKGTKIAILHMAKRGKGVIINNASILGIDSLPSTNAYAASKHAVVGWTRSFKLLPQVCNVRVNAVCPHFIDTEMTANQLPAELLAKAGPMVELMPKINKAAMSTVIKAVLTLIQDETRNAQVLLALPNDILQVADPSVPDIVKNGSSAQFDEDFKKYERDYVMFSKEKLEESLKMYEEQYSTDRKIRNKL